MNTIHNAIERRNYLQFDILSNQRVGLNRSDAKGLTPIMKVNHDPTKRNATEMVSIRKILFSVKVIVMTTLRISTAYAIYL